ncbi:MAG: sensor histidine kinase [Acidobacteriia bacterium]|nr:sensor histidine kinase [Terriglobia bacterium]
MRPRRDVPFREPPYTQDMDNGNEWGDLDTRIILKVYGALAGLGGLALFGWGDLLLRGPRELGRYALIRVFGSILMGAACCALGFAGLEEPAARRRGLLWFALGHTIVTAVVVTQQITIWGKGTAEWASQLLVAIAASLLFLWYTAGQEFPAGKLTSLFGGRASVPAENLRSKYERQIREAAAQEERNRLARELHDSIKQQVFVIQTAAATAQARFDGDSGGAREALDQVRASAHDVMTEMEVMLDQLRAEPLENTGLVAALKKQCETLGFRTGAEVAFQLGELPASTVVPPGAQQAVLRVAQEALANVARHARATHVSVRLGKTAGGIELAIRDDGAGFDPNQSRRGMGTANMHARAEEFGGTFELASQPGQGTSIRFFLPYDAGTRSGWNRRTIWALGVVFFVFVQWQRTPVALVILAVLTGIYLITEHRIRKQRQADR